MIDFPSLKHKFSFFLDRKQMRITLDVASNSIIHSKHFNVANINETSIIRSLAFQFHENTVTLYVDCVESSKLEIDVGLTKLYLQMDEPVIKLFRERKYPLHFDTTVQSAFGRANCQKGSHKHSGKRFNRIKQSDKGNIKMKMKIYYSNGNGNRLDDIFASIWIALQKGIKNVIYEIGINRQMKDILIH